MLLSVAFTIMRSLVVFDGFKQQKKTTKELKGVKIA
jgi:hypothetical protein